MLSVSLDYVEGVVDVSIIVPVCFDNPLKKYVAEFLEEVLALRKKGIVILCTAYFTIVSGPCPSLEICWLGLRRL